MKKFFIAFILASVVSFISLWLVFDFIANQKASDDSTEIVYEVTPGKSFNSIAKELRDLGIIKNEKLFLVYTKVMGIAGKHKVGEYSLRKNMNPKEIVQVLNSGISLSKPFTIPEGKNIFEISEAFEKEGFGKKIEFMEIAQDKKLISQYVGLQVRSLEGYLFPDTYHFTKHMNTREIILIMLKKFEEVWAEVEKETKNTQLTKHQIVTLASIIEKETGAPEERPRISSVFHNRLRKGMMLQTDPTVLYGKAIDLGRMIISITRADLTKPTAYNTYVIKGLPPGPIASPSKEALLAAIYPEKTEYLFFVSENDGRHTFTTNYQDHLKAVKKFQLDPKAREGKSWRDLNKKQQK
jgi:UPF0755 protein